MLEKCVAHVCNASTPWWQGVLVESRVGQGVTDPRASTFGTSRMFSNKSAAHVGETDGLVSSQSADAARHLSVEGEGQLAAIAWRHDPIAPRLPPDACT